jgi:hypothetical protein
MLLNKSPPLPQLNGQCSNIFPPPPLPSQKETPFIFEEPKKLYYLLSHAERARLLALGPLAPCRLFHMERIHVVVQSPSQIQVTVARRLDLPHYQAKMAHVEETVHPSIHVYKDDYEANDFIYVSCQHSQEVTSLLSTINFEEIGANLLSLKPNDSVRHWYYLSVMLGWRRIDQKCQLIYSTHLFNVGIFKFDPGKVKTRRVTDPAF